MFRFECPKSGHVIEGDDEKKVKMQARFYSERFEPSQNSRDTAEIYTRRVE